MEVSLNYICFRVVRIRFVTVKFLKSSLSLSYRSCLYSHLWIPSCIHWLHTAPHTSHTITTTIDIWVAFLFLSASISDCIQYSGWYSISLSGVALFPFLSLWVECVPSYLSISIVSMTTLFSILLHPIPWFHLSPIPSLSSLSLDPSPGYWRWTSRLPHAGSSLICSHGSSSKKGANRGRSSRETPTWWMACCRGSTLSSNGTEGRSGKKEISYCISWWNDEWKKRR